MIIGLLLFALMLSGNDRGNPNDWNPDNYDDEGKHVA